MNENPELEGPHGALIADLALMLAGLDEHECSEWYANTKAVLKAWFKREHREWNDYQLDAAANRVVDAIQLRKLQPRSRGAIRGGARLNRVALLIRLRTFLARGSPGGISKKWPQRGV